jgi:hypothetical protein
MEKAKLTAVTDPADIEALLERKDELDTPEFYAPNGHLWAVAEQYRAWRAGREARGDV